MAFFVQKLRKKKKKKNRIDITFRKKLEFRHSVKGPFSRADSLQKFHDSRMMPMLWHPDWVNRCGLQRRPPPETETFWERLFFSRSITHRFLSKESTRFYRWFVNVSVGMFFCWESFWEPQPGKTHPFFVFLPRKEKPISNGSWEKLQGWVVSLTWQTAFRWSWLQLFMLVLAPPMSWNRP